jgi:hypothetical protein
MCYNGSREEMKAVVVPKRCLLYFPKYTTTIIFKGFPVLEKRIIRSWFYEKIRITYSGGNAF